MSMLKTIIILVGFVFVAFVICVVLGSPYFNVELFKPVYTYVTGFFTKMDFSDPATLLTTGGAGVTGLAAAAVPLLSKLDEGKRQLEIVASNANTQISGLTSQVNTYKEQITSQTKDYETKIADLTKQAEEYKNQLEGPTSKISQLQAQVQAVQDQNSQFIKGLMSSANGALVTNPVDGKIYSVLKVPPEIYIK